MQCVNCSREFQETEKYCSNCGNEKLCDRITIRSLINEFFSKYFSLDSKLIVTVKDMTVQPQEVILSYINNNRKKYLPPINFMIIAGLLGGFYAYLLNSGYLGELDYEALVVDQKSEVGIDQVEFTKSINTTVQKYYSLITFLTIPLLALISKLVFYNYKQFNFAEHSVIYAYGYSQFLILSYVSIPFSFILDNFIYYYSILSFVLLIGFHIYILKRLFDISWGKMMVKTLLFFAIGLGLGLILMFLGGVIVFIYVLLSR